MPTYNKTISAGNINPTGLFGLVIIRLRTLQACMDYGKVTHICHLNFPKARMAIFNLRKWRSNRLNIANLHSLKEKGKALLQHNWVE